MLRAHLESGALEPCSNPGGKVFPARSSAIPGTAMCLPGCALVDFTKGRKQPLRLGAS
jgi:hypothetical protein